MFPYKEMIKQPSIQNFFNNLDEKKKVKVTKKENQRLKKLRKNQWLKEEDYDFISHKSLKNISR